MKASTLDTFAFISLFVCLCLSTFVANIHHKCGEIHTGGEEEDKTETVNSGESRRETDRKKLLLSDLPNDCIQSILALLVQSDLIQLLRVSKHFNAYCNQKLFSNLYITLNSPIKTKQAMPDISCKWTFLTPDQFWKMMNLYKFNLSVVKNLFIDKKTLSSNYVNANIFAYFASSNIISMGNTIETKNINNNIASVNINEEEISVLKDLSNLRNLSITSTDKYQPVRELSTVNRDIDNLIINSLTLIGDPLKVQQHFCAHSQNISRYLEKLTLVFQNIPTQTLITPLIIPTNNIKKFELRFNSTYSSKERISYVDEIENGFLKHIAFPNIKQLSISSQDIKNRSNIEKNNSYKYSLPNFNDFLKQLPPLQVLHLSIGNENNLTNLLPGILAHKDSLKRIAWIGNVNEDAYPKIELIGNLRFDMINGIFLKSPIELGRRSSLSSENQKDLDFESSFKNSMLKIGKARGDNYFHLDDYNYCKNEIVVADDFISNIQKCCNANFVKRFTKLQYLIINGLHFKVIYTYDGNTELVSVYN